MYVPSLNFLLAGTQALLLYGIECDVVQRSVPWSLKFTCHTEDATWIFDSHDVDRHMFADDNQVYASYVISIVDAVCFRIFWQHYEHVMYLVRFIWLQLMNGAKSDLSGITSL